MERGGRSPHGGRRGWWEERGRSPALLQTHSLTPLQAGVSRGRGRRELGVSSGSERALGPDSGALCCLGAVLRSRSAADRREAGSERLPLRRRRALKLSLLLDL